jgi:hypothetical protein
VRLTGRRDEHGNLRDGFLASFVNTSRVEPIADPSAYATALDELLTVLSRLGLHARHITIHGRLAVWQRRQVRGITLRYDHVGLPLGDIVLLWNADDPTYMALDLGTALERLAWARSRRPWDELVFGPLVCAAPAAVLDAIRTATLLLGHGITAASRGAGGITRRITEAIPQSAAPLGLSAAVDASHAYWHEVAPLLVAWPDVNHMLEQAVAARRPG